MSRDEIPVIYNFTPTLAPGVKWQKDISREQWVLVSAGRAYVPDDTEWNVLRRVDGKRSFTELVDQLAPESSESRRSLTRKLFGIFRDLSDEGVVEI